MDDAETRGDLPREGVLEAPAPLSEPAPTPIGRLLVAVVLVGVVVGLLFASDVSFRELRQWIAATGVWAPLVYLVLFTLAALVVTPGTALIVTAALLFPLWLALLLAWSGSVVAAAACFVVARRLGAGFVARLMGDGVARVDAHIADHGFQVVLLLRLAGLPPFNMLNYAAGLTRVRFVDYLAATALGVIPLVVTVVTLVSRIGSAPSLRDVFTDPVLYAAFLGVLVVVVGANLLRRRAGRVVGGPEESASDADER